MSSISGENNPPLTTSDQYITLESTDGKSRKFKVQMFKNGEKVSLSNIKTEDLQQHICAMIPEEIRGTLKGRVTIKSNGLINDHQFSDPSKLKVMKESFQKINELALVKIPKGDGAPVDSLKGRKIKWEKLPIPNWAKSAFHNLGKTFARIKSTIFELFQRLFQPSKWRAEQQSRAKNIVEKPMKTVEDMGSLGETSEAYVIGKGVIQSEKINITKRSYINNLAVQKKLYNEQPEIKSGNITLNPVRFEGEDLALTEGKTYPTSFRKGQPEDANHLVNCYHSESKGQKVIRSAVIDTETKAKELIKLTRSLQPEGKIRLVSHQLNSFETETAMIDNQHRELLTNRDDEGIEIAHINTPANRIVEYTKLLNGKILKGEAKSKEQNIEGWMQYASWLHEDLPEDSIIKTFLKTQRFTGGGTLTEFLKLAPIQMSEKFSNVKALEIELSTNPDTKRTKEILEEIKEIKGRIIELRSSIRNGLTTFYNHLKNFEMNHSEKLGDQSIKIELMRRILGSQLGIEGEEPMTRGMEIALMQLLNTSLGVVYSMNCKSGLDRTGFAHAVMMAQHQTREDGQTMNDLLTLFTNWDKTTYTMNKCIRDKGVEAFNEELQGNEEWQKVNSFRKHVLDNLLKHTIPISVISTGVAGIKWSKGMRQNRHAQNFIPSHVKIEGSDDLVQLVNFHPDGQPKELTKAGENLLLQFSSLRGA